MKFNELLIRSRQKANISLIELQKISGVSKSTISYYEHGGTPTLDKADKLLKALDICLTIGEEGK